MAKAFKHAKDRSGSGRASGIANVLALLAIILAAVIPAPASANDSPVVVELFTSQGCSSCPPADKFFGELAQQGGIIALAFHVDYWNYIGWKDPYASRAMTQRQKDYARTLHQPYLYTPEIVIDGEHHQVGSDRDAIEKLIAAAKKAPPGPTVSMRRDDKGEVHIDIGAATLKKSAAVWFVTFDRRHTTTIERGENAGKKLTDYQVVRGLRRIATYTGAPLDLVADAPKDGEPGDDGCAVLVQHDGVGPVLAAAMLRYDGSD